MKIPPSAPVLSFMRNLKTELGAIADKEAAKGTEKYMRNLFTFLGIKTPARKEITKPLLAQLPVKELPYDQMTSLAQWLWQQTERDYAHVAIELINEMDKSLKPGITPYWRSSSSSSSSSEDVDEAKRHLDFLEGLIRDRSWWDTVDLLASGPLGRLISREPSLLDQMDVWITCPDSFWIRRSALLFQLKYKKDTDVDRLFRYIRLTMHEDEFFIRKAIGWTLRELSKTNKKAVKEFIEANRIGLSTLSVREGSKYLN